MGAHRAAWVAAMVAENAAFTRKHLAHGLLDLVKAFELIPHLRIITACKALGYPLTILRLSLSAYRLPRTMGIQGIYSTTVVATQGITAGSGFATDELHATMYIIVREAYEVTLNPSIAVYVYDTSCHSEKQSPPEPIASAAEAPA